jgi:4-hydroxy-tetrahydrodipicolinate synthase
VKVLDSHGEWYGAVRRHLRDVAVFVPGHHIATGMAQGAQGSYSNVACLTPRGAAAWERLIERDPPRALDVQRRVIDFLALSVGPYAADGYCGPALDKFLAAIGAWADIGTRLRWPYRSIPEREAERFRATAREMIPELWPA